MGAIAVTGSVAIDTIMVFPGRFRDHILPDKTHLINVSFLVNRLERHRGGNAANVSYTLALLGEPAWLCAAVGNDFSDYGEALRAVGVDTSTAFLADDLPTAACYITTDLDDNQITAFFPGAMARAAEVDLTVLGDVEHVIISPDDPAAMTDHVEQADRIGAKIIFSPAQQIPSLSDAALVRGCDAAWLIVANDYEMEMIRSRVGISVDDLASDRLVAVTRGTEGSEIHSPSGTALIPAAETEVVRDPTGAGDAYLAGLLSGLRRGHPLDVAGRHGSVAAAYCVEHEGTQGHSFTRAGFDRRLTGGRNGQSRR